MTNLCHLLLLNTEPTQIETINSEGVDTALFGNNKSNTVGSKLTLFAARLR